MSIHRFKVLLLGNTKIGKTTLTTTDIQSSYTKQYIPTIGCNYTVKSIRIPTTQSHINNTIIELHLYDISGNIELYNRLYPSYMTDSAAVIVCYDLAERKSYDDITKWYTFYQQHVKQQYSDDKPMLSCVVGLKGEMRENDYACCTVNEAEQLAEKYSGKYMECSAAMNRDTDVPFNHIADLLYKQYVQGQGEGQGQEQHTSDTSTSTVTVTASSNVKGNDGGIESHPVEGEVF